MSDSTLNVSRSKKGVLIGEHLAVSREFSSQFVANKGFAATSEFAKWVFDFWRTRSGIRSIPYH